MVGSRALVRGYVPVRSSTSTLFPSLRATVRGVDILNQIPLLSFGHENIYSLSISPVNCRSRSLVWFPVHG